MNTDNNDVTTDLTSLSAAVAELNRQLQQEDTKAKELLSAQGHLSHPDVASILDPLLRQLSVVANDHAVRVPRVVEQVKEGIGRGALGASRDLLRTAIEEIENTISGFSDSGIGTLFQKDEHRAIAKESLAILTEARNEWSTLSKSIESTP